MKVNPKKTRVEDKQKGLKHPGRPGQEHSVILSLIRQGEHE